MNIARTREIVGTGVRREVEERNVARTDEISKKEEM